MDRYGIVIIGYKNTKGIERLFNSLTRVDFSAADDLTLIVSVDFSGDNSVEKLANSYVWEYGEKHVIAYKENLGLKKHILSCGDYMDKYDLSAIIVLEDDIYVSPEMYNYMISAIHFYKDDPKIAGISLYKHEYNICAKHPFYDYCDYGDTYFMQYAMSWGQIWIKNQWKLFMQWYLDEKWKTMDKKRIPPNLFKWKNSWLKFHIMYCIDQDLYFVYPRMSLSTDFSDVGAHNSLQSTAMQVKLCMNKNEGWNFSRLVDTKAVYDAFFENVNLPDFLRITDAEIDLYGIKDYQSNTRFVVTTKVLHKKIIKSWGLQLRPMEANIYLDIPGEDIFLYDLSENSESGTNKNNRMKTFEYDLKGLNIVCSANIKYCIGYLSNYIKIKIKKVIPQNKK